MPEFNRARVFDSVEFFFFFMPEIDVLEFNRTRVFDTIEFFMFEIDVL